MSFWKIMYFTKNIDAEGKGLKPKINLSKFNKFQRLQK